MSVCPGDRTIDAGNETLLRQTPLTTHEYLDDPAAV
jgi:hypothetical protein